MLESVRSAGELVSPDGDAFFIMIKSLAKCYIGRVYFTCMRQGNSAFICGVNGYYVLSSSDDADFDEIASYLGFTGFDKLLCSAQAAERLGFDCVRNGSVMRCVSIMPGSDRVSRCENKKDYAAVFDLVSPEQNFENWFCDLASRNNAGSADTRLIKVDDKVVSTASKLHMADGKSIIGAVATGNSYQGRGLASELVVGLSDRGSFLFCEDGLVGFYARLGYVECGRWCEVVNEF